jgi:preprotein translocase subunit Sec61beta
MSTKKASGLKYFSEETAGFKIQPKTVLIMSLIYIGLVVLLHIYAKLGAAKPVTIEAPTAPTANPTDSAEQAEAEAEAQ